MSRKELNKLKREVRDAESFAHLHRIYFRGAVERLRRAKSALTSAERNAS